MSWLEKSHIFDDVLRNFTTSLTDANYTVSAVYCLAYECFWEISRSKLLNLFKRFFLLDVDVGY